MKSSEVSCPNCGGRLAVPPDLQEGKTERVICPACGARVRLRCRRSQTGLAEISTTAELRRLKIPGYQLLERLGKGGMASVFCAIHSASGRKVAVKILPPASAQNPDLVLRFEREARLLATLDHPGVVQILDRGRIGSTYFFAMEYIEGHTLKERLEGGMLPLDEALRILICAGEAVHYCHDHGVVHRDLKPGNIIITASGQVKVMDFGISGLLRRLGDITEQGVLIGTPQYVAPEQLRDGSRIDPRADQFSLAVIMYEMLTNSLPVGVFQPASALNPDAPAALDAVLAKALARDPEDRFRSVREFIHEIRKAAGAALLEPTPPLLSPVAPLKSEAQKEKDGASPTPQGIRSAPREDADSTPVPLETQKPGESGGGEKGRGDRAIQMDQKSQAGPASRTGQTGGTYQADQTGGAREAPSEFGADEAPRAAKRHKRRRRIPLALVPLAVLVLMACGFLFFHRGGRTASPAVHLLVGGLHAPSWLGAPITNDDALKEAENQEGLRGYLAVPRLASGHWVASPSLFQGGEIRRLAAEIPLHLVDSSPAAHSGGAWAWRQGMGLVITACPPGQSGVRVQMALAAPLSADSFHRALADALSEYKNALKQPAAPPATPPVSGQESGADQMAADFSQWRMAQDPDALLAGEPGAPGTPQAPISSGTLEIEPGTGDSYTALAAEKNARGLVRDWTESQRGVRHLVLRGRSRSLPPARLVATLQVAAAPESAQYSTAWQLVAALGADWEPLEIRWPVDVVSPGAQTPHRLLLHAEGGAIDFTAPRIEWIESAAATQANPKP